MDPITKYVVKRIMRNQNFLGMITGPTGTGKSYAAISLGFRFNAAMGIKEPPRIFYELTDFIDFLKAGDFVPGQTLIIDEGGLMAQARAAMTRQNRIISMISQSFRYMRLSVIFCVPHLSFIDSNVRKLVHVVMITNRINRSKGLCYLRAYKVRNDLFSNQMRFIKLRTLNYHGDSVKVNEFGVPKPPQWFLTTYEIQKDDYIKQKLKKFTTELEQKQKVKGAHMEYHLPPLYRTR